MKKLFGVIGFVTLTLFFLAVLANLLYWGLIIVAGFIGVFAYVVIGVGALLLIICYLKVLKILSKKYFTISK